MFSPPCAHGGEICAKTCATVYWRFERCRGQSRHHAGAVTLKFRSHLSISVASIATPPRRRGSSRSAGVGHTGGGGGGGGGIPSDYVGSARPGRRAGRGDRAETDGLGPLLPYTYCDCLRQYVRTAQ